MIINTKNLLEEQTGGLKGIIVKITSLWRTFVLKKTSNTGWNVNLLILLLQCLHCNSFHLFLSEGDTLYAYSTISDFFTPVSDLNDNKTAFSIIISNYRAHRTALNFLWTYGEIYTFKPVGTNKHCPFRTCVGS